MWIGLKTQKMISWKKLFSLIEFVSFMKKWWQWCIQVFGCLMNEKKTSKSVGEQLSWKKSFIMTITWKIPQVMSGREAFNNDDDVCMPFHATRKMNIFRSAGVL